MKELLKEAKELEAELIANRRYLHENPECGYELENTCRFVMEKLTEYGYEPEMICKSGIVAKIGDETKGKTIMLRADMDALPMYEETDLPFKSTKEAAHTCGHDIHMAMLLGAAKLLKQHENELEGCVKLMFQPDEEGSSPEGIGGCDMMMDAGILENPKVDAVFAIHIMPSDYETGKVYYRAGAFMCSCDNFYIKIQGKGAHGSQPYNAVSPINIAAHIYFGIQEMIARELPAYEQGVVTVGSIHSGDATNIIPDTAEISGTVRMAEEHSREKIKQRMKEMCEYTAKAYGGSCEVTYKHGIPSVYCNPALTKEIVSYHEELLGVPCIENEHVNPAGDDLSSMSQRVPTCYMVLGGGSKEEGYPYNLHSPHILFNEEAIHTGTALYANTAIEWLKNH